jgi:subtilisin family serine protease
MMRRAGRHTLICWIILAGSLVSLPGWTYIKDAKSQASKIPARVMGHIRASGRPYVATFSNNATAELWQYRDPEVGYVVDVRPRALVVCIDPSMNRTQQDAAFNGFVRSEDHRYQRLQARGIFLLTVPDAASVADLLAAKAVLVKRAGVRSVSLDFRRDYALVPNDPMYNSQRHHPQMKNPEAWDILPGQQPGAPTVVAILDSGVDITHPDLAAAIWVNSGEIAGDGIDNDGNGFVDDVNGWDFAYDNNNVQPNGEPHGTHVAGIAAAIANNGVGVAGTGYSMTIMPVQVGDYYIFNSDAVAGVAYAIDNGAHVMNMSFGGFGYDPTYDVVFKEAYENNIGLVISAGNDNIDIDTYPYSPVCNDGDNNWVTGVAATDFRDVKASFSNYGRDRVDISAPGVNILSTMPGGAYGTMSGTSMASPAACGIMALIRAYRPQFPISRIQAALIEFADNIDRQNPVYVGLLGSGRVNSEARY